MIRGDMTDFEKFFSDFDREAGEHLPGDGAELFAEEEEGGFAGAMAGEEELEGGLTEAGGEGADAGGRGFVEMEAADEGANGLAGEGGCDLAEDDIRPGVGAGGENGEGGGGFEDEGMLMAEIIRAEEEAAAGIEGVAAAHFGEIGRAVGQEMHAGEDFLEAGGAAEARGVVAEHAAAETVVGGEKMLPAEAVFAGFGGDPDRGGGIEGEEAIEAVGVVVVGVGEHGEVDGGEIDAEARGVVRELAGSAGVQQDFVAVVLDMDGQAPLADEIFMGEIIDQDGGTHGIPPSNKNGLPRHSDGDRFFAQS